MHLKDPFKSDYISPQIAIDQPWDAAVDMWPANWCLKNHPRFQESIRIPKWAKCEQNFSSSNRKRRHVMSKTCFIMFHEVQVFISQEHVVLFFLFRCTKGTATYSRMVNRHGRLDALNTSAFMEREKKTRKLGDFILEIEIWGIP